MGIDFGQNRQNDTRRGTRRPSDVPSRSSFFSLGRTSNPQRRPPPNYFSRREQLRLFVMVSALMGVLIAMNEVRKPANWAWLWAFESPPPTAILPDQTPVDTRLDPRPAPKPSVSDGFQVVAISPLPQHAERDAERDAEQNAQQDAVQTQRRGDLLSEGVTSPTQHAGPIPQARTFATLTPELLGAIEDNTVLRAKENRVWLEMFRILIQLDQHVIESQSQGRVGFQQLFRQTDVYRGRLVTVAGTVRRLEAISPRPNEIGMDQLFRWTLEPTGGANAPIIVYSLEKPTPFTPGVDRREYCEFTGFYFKRWAYPAADGTRIAPLILAKSATWSPTAAPPTTHIPSAATVALIVGTLACAAAGFAYFAYWTTQAQRADITRLRGQERSKPLHLDTKQVRPSIGDSLRQIASEDTASPQPDPRDELHPDLRD